ncbi:hypothetical protein BH739_04690 [Enterococcus casseliflavus]|nr:hypothetical protein BH739_04690 [Enterococcus casseliflavus]
MLSEQKTKNLINKYAKEYDVLPQQLYSLYGLEQLLVKIDQSEYRNSFVLKGGYLLASIYGLSNRVTRDLDATIRHMALTEEKVQEFIRFIESPNDKGVQQFQLKKQKIIREKFEYDGYNLKFTFLNGKMKIPIEIDMTTGEQLLPLLEEQTIPLMFGEGSIHFPMYPLEQILSDKLYTTIAYGSIDDTNSRTKDLYDIYFLTKFNDKLSVETIGQSIQETLKQRNMNVPIREFQNILTTIETSPFQQKQWKNFEKENSYASGVSFESIMNQVKRFSMNVIDAIEQKPREKLSVADKLKEAQNKMSTKEVKQFFSEERER